MKSSDLTPEQCRVVRERLAPAQRYLHALLERCRQEAFPADDKLRQLTQAAHDAVFSLSIELHYLSCQHGVGRRPRSEP